MERLFVVQGVGGFVGAYLSPGDAGRDLGAYSDLGGELAGGWYHVHPPGSDAASSGASTGASKVFVLRYSNGALAQLSRDAATHEAARAALVPTELVLDDEAEFAGREVGRATDGARARLDERVGLLRLTPEEKDRLAEVRRAAFDRLIADLGGVAVSGEPGSEWHPLSYYITEQASTGVSDGAK